MNAIALAIAEGEDYAGAQAKTALAIVTSVWKLRVQIFGLRKAHGEVMIYFPVHAATGGEIKIVALAERSQPRSERTGIERAGRTSSAH